jgi:hypothetical protein
LLDTRKQESVETKRKMGNKEKRAKKMEKHIQKFEAASKKGKGTTPPVSPAIIPRSPALAPVKMHKPLMPFEALPGRVFALVASFAARQSGAAAAKDALDLLSRVSRASFLNVEYLRHRSGEPTAAMTAAACAPPSGVTLPMLLVPVDGDSARKEQLLAVAFRVVKQGRSVLHRTRPSTATAEASDFIINACSGDTPLLPVNTRHRRTGRTLLHCVCRYGDVKLALRLLRLPTADPFAVDDAKKTVLHVAAEENLTDVALFILRYHIVDSTKRTAVSAMVDAAKMNVVDSATHYRHSQMASLLSRELGQCANDDDDGDDDYDEYDEYDDDDY